MFATNRDTVIDVRASVNRPGNTLLATLPLEDYQRVEPHLTSVQLSVHQILHRQGEVIQHVFFPGGGVCSLMRVMGNGTVVEIATIGREGVIGASVFFGDDQSFGDVMVQVAEGDGFRIPVEAFVMEMARRGAFYHHIIRYSQALMNQVMQTTACNALHSIEQRCCRWLLIACDRVGRDHLRVTHELIATILGVRRPSVTIIMAALQKRGLVEGRRGMIHLTDRPALEAAACECYETVQAIFARLLPELSRAS